MLTTSKILSEISIRYRRLKYLVSFRVQNNKPQLVVHEKLEFVTKWILRIIVVLGIITSVVSISPWYLSLAVALLLLLLEWLIEKHVIAFTTIFVTAYASYDPSDWVGAVWGYDLEEKLPFTVGMIFKNEEAAGRVFGTIRKWNYDEDNDYKNNIQVSAVVEVGDKYSFYVYPSLKGEKISKWQHEVEEKNPGKVHHGLATAIIYCKQFRLSASNFQGFWNQYKEGESFWFAPYVHNEGKAVPSNTVNPIRMYNLKIKNRETLQKNDFEYDHGRMLMKT